MADTGKLDEKPVDVEIAHNYKRGHVSVFSTIKNVGFRLHIGHRAHGGVGVKQPEGPAPLLKWPLKENCVVLNLAAAEGGLDFFSSRGCGLVLGRFGRFRGLKSPN